MSRTKQQHYLPRFHLDYFKDADGKVWTFDTVGGDVWAASPANTARQGNFYSPKDESGEYIDGIEDWLTNIESTAAPLYAQVIEGKVLRDQERADFSAFLASLYARSPANIRTSAELQGHAIQFAYSAYLGDRDLFDRSFDEMDKEKGTTTSKEDRDEAFEFANKKDAYTLEVNQHAGLMGIAISDRIAPIFYDMKWDLIAVDDQHLITSDSPVARVPNPDDYHPIYGDGGFFGKRTYVTFPLSPHRLLQLTWSKKPEGEIIRASRRQARVFNIQRAYCSERYLFASTNDSGIRRLGKKYKNSRPTIEMIGMDKMADVNVSRSMKKD